MGNLDGSQDTYTCSKCGGLYHGMYEICPADLENNQVHQILRKVGRNE